MPDAIIKIDKSTFSPNFPYSIRLIPIHTAKPQGPARSPTVFDTFNADSANAEAHGDIAISDEPAQTINTINIQKNFEPSNCLIVMLSPSSKRFSIGQVIKLYML